jgi:hypothetical protein
MPTQLEIAQIEAILSEFNDHQEAVLLARGYYQGNQDIYLNDRALEYLGIHKDNTFRFNMCKTIVRALADELNLIGMGTDEEAEEEDTSKPVAEWVAEVFERNKVDQLQKETHKAALADSESFVIVEWDPEEEFPKFTLNPFYIGTDISDSGGRIGDGMGCYMIYENNDPTQKVIAAVKEWIELIPRGATGAPYSRRRRTIYYPDHFERWVMESGGIWDHFIEPMGTNEDGEPQVRDWRIENVGPDGEPLGIPVFHFKNEDLAPEHWDAIPMQDATNKSLVDVLAAGDLTAFQSFFGFGFYPTIDGKVPTANGSNLMKMGPAQFNGTTKSASEASLQVITGQDPTPLMNQFKDLVLATAQITDTPADRFIVTAQIASADTLKGQEAGLRKKAKTRRKLFGDPWVGVFDMARTLSNLYGGAGLSEDVSFSPIWETTVSLDELQQKKDTLGISIEQLWREAGYNENQIAAMKQDPSFRVEFERKLWEGYQAASLNGIPLRTYLERIGVPKAEIDALEKSIRENSSVPSEDL